MLAVCCLVPHPLSIDFVHGGKAMVHAKKITAADRGKRLARGPITIGALTERIAKPALGKRGFAGGEILARWTSIVGDDLATFAVPLEVKFPRGKNAGATLVLRISSGAAATMLHLKTPLILERINAFFGYKAIDKVQAAQGPLPRAKKIPRPARTSAPKPVNLSEALDRLGAAVQQRAARDVDIKTSETKPSAPPAFPPS